MSEFARAEPAAAGLAAHLGIPTPGAMGPRGGDTTICKLMVTTVLLSALRAWAATAREQTWPPRTDDPFLARVVSAVIDDPGREWTIDHLAALGAMSRSVFAARFRQVFGTSPASYVTEVRMRRAKELLDAGTGVSETSRALGYASDEGFRRAFRRHVGVARRRGGRVGASSRSDPRGTSGGVRGAIPQAPGGFGAHSADPAGSGARSRKPRAGSGRIPAFGARNCRPERRNAPQTQDVAAALPAAPTRPRPGPVRGVFRGPAGFGARSRVPGGVRAIPPAPAGFGAHSGVWGAKLPPRTKERAPNPPRRGSTPPRPRLSPDGPPFAQRQPNSTAPMTRSAMPMASTVCTLVASTRMPPTPAAMVIASWNPVTTRLPPASRRSGMRCPTHVLTMISHDEKKKPHTETAIATTTSDPAAA